MPGPNEPSKDINTYLEPLVIEMEKLWNGTSITVNSKPIVIRAAISCLAYDIPAARKVGGFVGHRGFRGCNICLKSFPSQHFGDYPDYSGFKKSEWEPRSHALHVWFGRKHKTAKTEVQRKAIEHEYGARYSLLYELPYYKAIFFCIVDPMHCLFLAHDLISDQQFSLIQSGVNLMKCPPDTGRIPYKIISKFAGLKADQWKSWTLYFSLFCLKDILPKNHFKCWKTFVSATKILCSKQVVEEKLLEAEKLVEEFCTKFEELYGKNNLTPNMHLAAHLTDCIRNHGPVYGFWLFAFERMNDIAGSFHANTHNITIQIMRKLTSMQSTDTWKAKELA